MFPPILLNSFTKEGKLVFIEFESRNKPSGIETTKSEFWLTELVDESEDAYAVIMIPTDRLRKMVENNNYPVKPGGDDYTSKGYLIPVGDLLNHKK